jgi:peptidoglycan hydrolase-like protein with peptidoglycan-binding domain
VVITHITEQIIIVMTITKDVSAKIAVAIVAVSMVFSAFATSAKAQTTEDLQKMINDLLAQVASLQSQVGQGGQSVASGVCPYTWTRDLNVGATGADVMKLQQFLNADLDTRVSMSGAGSVGSETEFYGPATAAAVSKMQVKYRADILSPANLVNPTGYFGPSSRAKANALCVTAPVVDTDDDATDEDEEDEDEDEDFELQGEASLDTFELDDAESTIEEGDEDAEIGEITVEFTDGDAEISRLDITLVGTSPAKPWDAFDTISLWVDGDKIAEVDASDEDDYLDEDNGELRFSNLSLIGEEDEELTIIVAASVQNNLDADERTDWTLEVSSVRFFDADGVATTEKDPAKTDTAEFDIEEAGADEEIKVSLASSNPDSTDIVVDTDTDTNDVTIMVADIEAEDNDIELNKVVVLVDTGVASTTKVVDEIRVVIDGESFKAETISGTGAPTGGNSTLVDVTGTSVWYVFDIDGDVTIDADDEVEMEVVVDFNDTDDGVRYANGTTIKASITTTERDLWEAEGADDLANGQFSGTAVGDTHTLVAEGILVPVDGFEASTPSKVDADGLIYQFQMDFEVTAVEGDYYIANAAAAASTSPTTGVGFIVSGGNGVVTAALDSTADEDTVDVFTVREGETETFTLTVTINPDAAGTFRVGLAEVHFTNNADGVTATTQYDVTPLSDFRTNSQSIAN